MKKKINRYAKKISIWFLKYIPIICNLVLLEMCFEVHFNISYISNSGYFYSGYSFLFIAFLFSLSLARGFCSWHLMLISNMLFSLTMQLFDFYSFKIPYIFYIISITTALSLLTTLIILTWTKITAKTWSLMQKQK